MEKLSKSLTTSIILCLLPIPAGAILYGQLPRQIPIHWNSTGQADNFVPKAVAVFLLPLLLCLLHLLVRFLLNHDPRRANDSPAIKAVGRWIVPICSLTCFTVSYTVGMGLGLDIPLLLSLLAGVVIVLWGNHLLKCKPNHATSIRLPWTLRDPNNWYKTRQLTGYVWVIGGLVLAFCSFFRIWWLQISIVLLLFLLPCVFFSWLHKKAKNRG